ncbi:MULTISPECIES: amidase [unclassified Modestobacter]|uniref:amidase n=1 Tax=unclassified Modestobacter TaxID=2643866 RepID=UPI0022AA4248|nr:MULTISPECIES: amidase [unclassified Modestobacter]MCZ2826453.1 amidase [Modestobacter sp. VKM Ac-2981]MCZ2852482.1 amidase [Modestobacter sp. VKM Ac-2982]
MTAAFAAALLVPASAVAAPADTGQAGPGVADAAGSGTLPIRGLDLDASTIPELQERMDAGELTAVQLTGAYLARIAAVNDDLGAVLSINPDALRDAAASDRTRQRGQDRRPLEGIPVLLKDNVDTEQLPTTAGSRAMLDSRPDDAEITRRLRDAGAIVLGKANLSEWANLRGSASSSGWSGVGGQTANPYVLDRNPCGSSSGSAVGVAASLSQVAIGTETDGSIVCPAGANGVIGVKPTLGLVSRTGIVPISAEQDTAGPMARHAVDAALVLEVLAGSDDADAATAEIPADLDTDFADLDLDALEGARIGVWTLTPEQSAAVDDRTEEVFAAAVKQIEAAGATAVPVQLAYQEEIGAGELPALLAEFKRDLNAYLAATPGDHPADLAGIIEFNEQDPVELAYFGQELLEQAQAATVPAEDPAIRETRDRIRTLARASIDEVLAQGAGPEDDLAAIVGLTNTPAWLTEYEYLDGRADAFVYSTSGPAAVAGYPNVTVPAGFAGPRDSLPVGVSFFGTRWDDARVLDIAADFEDQAAAREAPGYLPTVGVDPQPDNPEPAT